MKRKKKQVETIKPVFINASIEKYYKNALKAFAKETNKSITYWVLSQCNKYQRGDIQNLNTALKSEFSFLKTRLTKKARRFSKKIIIDIQKKIVTYIDKSYSMQGLDTSSKKHENILKTIYYNNMELIKSIPLQTIQNLENSLYPAIYNFDMQQIKKILTNSTNITQRRAELIARDQVGKAITAYASERAKDLGFTYYVWRTSRDERVSKGKGGHLYLDDRIYAYENPTAIIDSYGNIGHPAQRVNCRCIQLPVFLKQNEKLKRIKDSVHGDYYKLV